VSAVILVCGEALIDLFVDAPGTASSLPASAVAAGSPFNLAVGLARLGAPAGYLGGLSADGFGRFLEARLRADGVDTALVKHSARPTPLVVVSPDAEGHPAYTFHAHDCAERDLWPADLPPQLPPAVTALAIGSYAMAVEPSGSTLLALAEREAGARVVSLDPNLRPALVGDLGRWRERFERFARTASIIKLSVEDLHIAYGPDTDPAAQARHWLGLGVGLVVLTLGEKGAVAFHAGGSLRQAGRAVPVADTVGAGDTFHAALLARLQARGMLSHAAVFALDSAALEDVLRYATLAASITCTRRGADMPRRAEVDAAMQAMR
jgi:fructokinase